MTRKGIKPRIRFSFGLPVGDPAYRRVFPFRRSWIAIGVLAVLDLVFLVPLVITFKQASSGWGAFDSLFDLVMTLFLSAWMLGWSIAPIIMTLILLLMLFGREVIRAGVGGVDLFIGLPGLGVMTRYDVSKMRNLRLERPEKKSGSSWRGVHVAFDYGANPVGFGSDLEQQDIRALESGIAAATGSLVGKGAARAEDLAEPWEPPDQAPQQSDAPTESLDSLEPVSWASPSSLALIIANLVPVAGAMLLGWSLGEVMVLYWAESAVIGFFNLLKIITIGRWGALFYGPFFLGHFGGFMSVHFLFIYTIFVAGPRNGLDAAGDLAEVWKLFVALWPALAALLISHAYSFFANFLGRQEYRGKTMSKQMAEPYSRIIFMHLALISGGWLALLLEDPAPVILIVIVVKIYLDLKAHIRQRGANAEPDAAKFGKK